MARTSKIIEDWKKEGAKEAPLIVTRKHLLTVLMRLRDPLPEYLRRAIGGLNDLVKLERWFDHAVRAHNYADFCRAVGLNAGRCSEMMPDD